MICGQTGPSRSHRACRLGTYPSLWHCGRSSAFRSPRRRQPRKTTLSGLGYVDGSEMRQTQSPRERIRALERPRRHSARRQRCALSICSCWSPDGTAERRAGCQTTAAGTGRAVAVSDDGSGDAGRSAWKCGDPGERRTRRVEEAPRNGDAQQWREHARHRYGREADHVGLQRTIGAVLHRSRRRGRRLAGLGLVCADPL